MGAGRGQLLAPQSGVRELVAIDSDPGALEGFRRDAKDKWAEIPISFVPRAFETVDLRADLVYFEFCLHQMADPRWALAHARSMARDIVVMDHLPRSKWMFYAAEDDIVLRSTQAVESFGIRRREVHRAVQRFRDYDELAARMSDQGGTSQIRTRKLKGARDIRIRMDYCLYLL